MHLTEFGFYEAAEAARKLLAKLAVANRAARRRLQWTASIKLPVN